MKMNRVWAMPSPWTFSIPPIKAFIERYLSPELVVVDPFCGNSKLATITNDLNPDTPADSHTDAETFLRDLKEQYERKVHVVLFDPPYSPRQVSECYKNVGKTVTMKDTQTACLYKRVRDAIPPLLTSGGLVFSFGWNSVGMGKVRGFEILEILLVSHGGAHNDTICVVERSLE